MSNSGIAWTEKTWSPVTGCTKVSAGCKNCYAEREVEGRWSKNPKSVFFGRAFTDVQVHENQLMAPMKWKEAHRIFVCPRGDLFHESVSFEFLDWVFATMALASQHTFQVLTKRPERMLEYIAKHTQDGVMVRAARDVLTTTMPMPKGHQIQPFQWPLPNVWLGVTVENQEAADERIPLLLQTPAAVHWISVEPMLGAVSCTVPFDGNRVDMLQREFPGHPNLHWVVSGGESGPNARPMHPDWARGLRDQCAAVAVPFLFKQWGEWGPHQARAGGDEGGDLRRGHVRYLQGDGREPDGHFRKGDAAVARVGTKTAGRLLNGVLHDNYPESSHGDYPLAAIAN